MLILFASAILAAAVARFGVLAKSSTQLSAKQLAGCLISAGVWGYLAAVAALMLRPEWAPYAVVGAAAFCGYVGDSSLFQAAKKHLKEKFGVDLSESEKVPAPALPQN